MVRPTLIGALTVTLAAAVWVSAAVQPSDGAGKDDWESAEPMLEGNPEMAAACRTADARMALARWRAEEKREAARALAHGRLTLTGAIARYRDLNAGDPSAIGLLADNYPSASEEEVICRQVFQFVRVLGAMDPAAVGALPALEAEFARRFPQAAGLGAV